MPWWKKKKQVPAFISKGPKELLWDAITEEYAPEVETLLPVMKLTHDEYIPFFDLALNGDNVSVVCTIEFYAPDKAKLEQYWRTSVYDHYVSAVAFGRLAMASYLALKRLKYYPSVGVRLVDEDFHNYKPKTTGKGADREDYIVFFETIQ
jgi:hypothetical protein